MFEREKHGKQNRRKCVSKPNFKATLVIGCLLASFQSSSHTSLPTEVKCGEGVQIPTSLICLARAECPGF